MSEEAQSKEQELGYSCIAALSLWFFPAIMSSCTYGDDTHGAEAFCFTHVAEAIFIMFVAGILNKTFKTGGLIGVLYAWLIWLLSLIAAMVLGCDWIWYCLTFGVSPIISLLATLILSISLRFGILGKFWIGSIIWLAAAIFPVAFDLNWRQYVGTLGVIFAFACFITIGNSIRKAVAHRRFERNLREAQRLCSQITLLKQIQKQSERNWRVNVNVGDEQEFLQQCLGALDFTIEGTDKPAVVLAKTGLQVYVPNEEFDDGSNE